MVCSSHIFVFWYFGPFSCVIFFQVFFLLAHLALQNVNKDCVIFSYFITSLPKVTKSKNGIKISHKLVVCDYAAYVTKGHFSLVDMWILSLNQ